MNTSRRAFLAAAVSVPLRQAGGFRLHPRRGPETRSVTWSAVATGIVVCDMWNDHWCKNAAGRVGGMAGKMNDVLGAARNRGAMIFHCPSDVMGFYEGTPPRKRMQHAAAASPEVKLARWSPLDPTREGKLPIDDTQSCDDDAPATYVAPGPWKRQHATIAIHDSDGVTDSGAELVAFCGQKRIENIAIMGVHLNRCVLGRSFGIRQLVRLGMNVVLVRDLTDALYDPRQAPYVSHDRGTELMVAHVEKHWCPSIDSNELVRRG